MARRPERGAPPSRYFVSFAFTALILGGITLFLVLVVLPRRYVLNAGLRESGVTFPSEAAPFSPPEEVKIEAPPRPPPPAPVLPGPAEVFWNEVSPLLESEQYAAALPVFREYLAAHPEDLGVRKEFGITLNRAGQPVESLQVLEGLLAERDDPGVRLLLARGLRDQGSLDEASVHYQTLLEQEPGDVSMALEWGRALSWGEEYPRAAQVLQGALARDPSSVRIRVELAQVYYAEGRLDDADQLLTGIDKGALAQAGAATLHADILAALTPPEPEEPQVDEVQDTASRTALDRAALAKGVEDYESAAVFYRVALRETPEDVTAWRDYADLLQYQLEDLEGAREGLLRVEELGGGDSRTRFRLAQLAIWTGRNEEASDRLTKILQERGAGVTSGTPGDSASLQAGEMAEVHALLGDLRRWEGDRARAGDTYLQALEADPGNERAQAGMTELDAEAAQDIEDAETPRMGGNAYSLNDSDDFSRLDMGLEGMAIDGRWVWGGRSGTRWLAGLDLLGSQETQRGLFMELEAARWWRWGTIRTGIHLGLEEVRPDGADYSFGGSLRFSDLGGFRADFRYDHGPAYPLTLTLQSVLSKVTQDRVTANLARQFGRRWSFSAAADATRVGHGDVPGGEGGSYRFEGGLSLGRSVTDHLIIGWNARALTYTSPSPVRDGLRLYWDPRALYAGGIYAQWEREVGERWAIRSRVNPSFALIDERERPGFQSVPHFSAELGFTHLGSRVQTSVDGFYYQGRFDGYRAYGVRISLNMKDLFGRRGAR